MKIFHNIFTLLLMIFLIDLFTCLNEGHYETLNYLEEKEYILNKTEEKETILNLDMDVNTILTKKCLIDIHQENPQDVSLEYKYKKGEQTTFKSLKNWITINDGDKHTLCYEIKKSKEKNNTLYLKIVVKNYKDKQKFSVKSVKSQFNFYLLIGLIVGGSALIVLLIIFLLYYCMYKTKTNVDDPINFDIVFAKVGPEDF